VSEVVEVESVGNALLRDLSPFYCVMLLLGAVLGVDEV